MFRLLCGLLLAPLALIACADAPTGSAKTLVVVGFDGDDRVAALYAPGTTRARRIPLVPPLRGEALRLQQVADAIPADQLRTYRLTTPAGEHLQCESAHESCALLDRAGRERCRVLPWGSQPVWARTVSPDGYLAVSQFPGPSLIVLGESRVDVYRLADCRHVARLRDAPQNAYTLLWQ